MRISALIVACAGVALIFPSYLDRSACGAEGVPAQVAQGVEIRLQDNPMGGGDNATSHRTSDNATRPRGIAGLDTIKDGEPIEADVLYGFVSETADHYQADGIFMKRTAEVTLRELRADPGKFRGKPVVVRGKLVRAEASALPVNPSGVSKVMEGDLQTDTDGMCTFFSTQVVGVPMGDNVIIRGLFMKLLKSATPGGQDVPLIITTHPVFKKRAAAPDDSGDGLLGWMIGLLATLGLAYFVLMYFVKHRGVSQSGQAAARRRALEKLGRPPDGSDVDALPPDPPIEPRKPRQP